jgi:hypothetical protein
MPDEIDQIIDDVASSPRSNHGDMGSVETQPIKDLIELKKFRAAQQATATPGGFLRRSAVRLIPPGAQ